MQLKAQKIIYLSASDSNKFIINDTVHGNFNLSTQDKSTDPSQKYLGWTLKISLTILAPIEICRIYVNVCN